MENVDEWQYCEDRMRRIGFISRKRVVLHAVAALLLATAFESSAEIYKYRDASGKVIFTDSPPPNAGEVEEVRPTVNTGIQFQPKKGSGGSATPAKDEKKVKLERLRRKALKRIDDRNELRKELTAELKTARARLKQLEEKRELDKEPQPEELGHSVIRHNTWLKESYYERMAEVDKEIEEARKDVAQAKRNLSQMKRSPRKKKKKK